MIPNSHFRALLLTASCAALAACQTTGSNGALNTAAVNGAMQRAAQQAPAEDTPQSAAYYEKLYLREPTNEDYALKFAAALREADYGNRAATVLSALADSPKASAKVKDEYAAIQLSLGNNEMAEKYAQRAIAQDPADAKAYHYLGIAQDAQGKAEEAEKSFRKGLDLWKGDPTPIMNNLALNLSNQGYLDEAIQILEKAKEAAPGRTEIERNLRIIRALKQSENPTTPRPAHKPKTGGA